MSAYYNEHDSYAAQWLRNLIAVGELPEGDVDERDIQDVRADDVRGYRQCHFFAGIGGWALALRLAGWPDDREVWTGSCPCQPHSSASHGRRVATDLWPVWQPLIADARPPSIFGEQVDEASAWLDGVCGDMEALGYTVRASVLPAYCAGFDHARERIYFAGHTNSHGQPVRSEHAQVARLLWAHRLAGDVVRPHGVFTRVAQLRAFGNAIVPALAAEFIGAVMECQP
jgi:DNA (cytosine-5)-methyltransferase 1